MSEAADAKSDDAKGSSASKGGSKMLPMLVGLNSLLLFGVLGFLVFQMMKPPQASDPQGHAKEGGAEGAGHEGAAPDGEGHGDAKGEGGAAVPGAVGGIGPMVKLTDFVIHLRNPDVDRYARMSFDAEVYAESDKDRLNANLPRIRDAFISYLSDRTLEDLRGSEGLRRTRDALQVKLREVVPDARVKALYISDFVVQ